MRICMILLAVFLMPAALTLHSQDFHSPVILSPYSLTISDVPVGAKSLPQPVTIMNTGNKVVHILGVAATGDFSQTNDCPTPPAGLGFNETCAIQVLFEPKDANAASGTLTITNDVPGVGPFIVMLSGSSSQGTSQIAVSPPSLQFDAQALGNTSAPQTATVSNSGKKAAQIATIAVSGDFTIMPSSTCNSIGQTVAPGASCTIVVTFGPLEPGERKGEVTINDDAEGSPRKISLSGMAK
jgi:hypothetical protein